LLGLPDSPTAVQARADAHDTPLSTLTGTPGWLGAGWIDQRDPFQRSTRRLVWRGLMS
jgi:hypothetical protein